MSTRLIKIDGLKTAAVTLICLLSIATIVSGQSATGRPDKKNPVKPTTPAKRTNVPAPTQTPENKSGGQTTDPSSTTQSVEVKPIKKAPEIRQEQRPVEPRTAFMSAALKQALNSVGLILVRNADDERAVPRGSGVIISANGLIATNYHVVREDNLDRVFDEITFSLPEVGMPATAESSKRFKVQVVQKSKDYDLALLRIIADEKGKSIEKSQTFQTIELADSSKVELMDSLVIIGFPATGGVTVTTNAGVVQGKDMVENWIKTDARLLHGNSGGAAIDERGRLIGIPTKVEVDRTLLRKAAENNHTNAVSDVYAIGYLRPSNLIAKMVETLHYLEARPADNTATATGNPPPVPAQTFSLKGLIKSLTDGQPIAGARVGLVSVESVEVTAESLLSWGNTNGEGKFELNRQVPAGKYKLRVKAVGFDLLTKEIEVGANQQLIVIELNKSQQK
ncbi:MAG: trypsin-like peptidase domain-containing protein [Acidobacteriota bacterium]